jgi:hypothetical protein
VPNEQQYAERRFAAGFGQRAAFGRCSDCGDALLDITDLVCKTCRRDPKNANPDFREREAGHRARIGDLFAGVHGSDSLDDVNKKFRALQRRKVKAA